MSGSDTIERGRESFWQKAWPAAYAELSAADRESPLQASELEYLAIAAFMVGKEAESDEAWERAHREFLSRGDTERAVRCAFWLAMGLLNRGSFARGGGWLARAHRMLEEGRHDCVEQGYLLLPMAIQGLGAGDNETALATFGQAVKIGERFGDRDLVTLARHGQGRALIRKGDAAQGVMLLDEAMVAVHCGRSFSDRGRDRLLQRDRGLSGDLRPSSGAGVDGGS